MDLIRKRYTWEPGRIFISTDWTIIVTLLYSLFYIFINKLLLLWFHEFPNKFLIKLFILMGNPQNIFAQVLTLPKGGTALEISLDSVESSF